MKRSEAFQAQVHPKSRASHPGRALYCRDSLLCHHQTIPLYGFGRCLFVVAFKRDETKNLMMTTQSPSMCWSAHRVLDDYEQPQRSFCGSDFHFLALFAHHRPTESSTSSMIHVSVSGCWQTIFWSKRKLKASNMQKRF